jgi:hypothetical protein
MSASDSTALRRKKQTLHSAHALPNERLRVERRQVDVLQEACLTNDMGDDIVPTLFGLVLPTEVTHCQLYTPDEFTRTAVRDNQAPRWSIPDAFAEARLDSGFAFIGRRNMGGCVSRSRCQW